MIFLFFLNPECAGRKTLFFLLFMANHFCMKGLHTKAVLSTACDAQSEWNRLTVSIMTVFALSNDEGSEQLYPDTPCQDLVPQV